MSQKSAAYALARLPIGMSFFGHGFVRTPKLYDFATGMATSFEETILPYGFVLAFAYILPIIELLLGLIILAGFAMRKAGIFGVILICILIFGSSLQENWAGIATQMFYGLYFSLLYLFADYNGYAIGNITKHT